VILGFTGTSRGMTQRQRATVRYLFNELQLTVLHHGDCVGADAEADFVAHELSAKVIVHPPSDPKLRAYCEPRDLAPDAPRPKPYLARNKDIALRAVDGLVAAPKEMSEVLRSGTWSTVRYARKLGRRVWLVFPDGTFKEEAAK